MQIFKPHPVIGYLFIPKLRTRIEHEGGGYLLRTNAAGFRSEREFEVSKKSDTSRILVFGDSFTAGDGVSNRQRYTDILASTLPGTEVYNFGLPGTGTDQHYLVWKEIASEFEHDLVVIAVQVENIRRVAARYRLSMTGDGREVLFAKPYFELSGDKLSLKGVPVPAEPLEPEDLDPEDEGAVDRGGRHPWLRKIINKMGVRDLAQRISGYQPLPEYDDPEGGEWKLMKAILRQWTSEIQKPVIVMPMPLYHYIEGTADPSSYQERFREISAFASVRLHDPLPEMLHQLDADERRKLRFPTDIHPTPMHHEILAQSLAEPILNLLESTLEARAGI